VPGAVFIGHADTTTGTTQVAELSSRSGRRREPMSLGHP
jgi:hypothetical protein